MMRTYVAQADTFRDCESSTARLLLVVADSALPTHKDPLEGVLIDNILDGRFVFLH